MDTSGSNGRNGDLAEVASRLDRSPLAGALSGRHYDSLGPWWFNAATVRGTSLIVVGVVVLAFPEAGDEVTRILAGLLLLVGAVTRIAFAVGKQHPPLTARERFLAALTGVTGVLLILSPLQTLNGIAAVIGVYALVRGLIELVVMPLRGRRPSAFTIIHGCLLLALGAMLLVTPGAALVGAVVFVATALVLVGILMLSLGLQRGRHGKPIDASAVTFSNVLISWVRLRDIGSTGRYDLGEKFYFEPPDRTNKAVSWTFMLLVSVAIATFGVIQDSTAVVIGAMLIAPLMIPILGMALAIVNGWWPRLGWAFAAVAAGVAMAIALSWIIGAWLPAVVPFGENAQITSRVSPNSIDMLIALAAGAAGAYANVDRRASDSVAGVAIAVALVPPLSVVGITLQAGMYVEAGGAMLLFLTNLVAILLSASLVFLLMGAAPMSRVMKDEGRIKQIVGMVLTIAVIISIPLSLRLDSSLLELGRERDPQSIVDDWASANPDLSVTEVTMEDGKVIVGVTGVGDLPPLDPLQEQLAVELGEDQVAVAVEYTPLVVFEIDEEGTTSVTGPETPEG